MPTPFTIRGLGGEQTGILGIWEPVASSPLSFSTLAATDREVEADEVEVVWSVSLPGDPGQASEMVKHQTHALHTAQQAMATSESTLHILSMDGVENTAFALEQTGESRSPEAVLRLHLAQLQYGDEALSFGLGRLTNWSKTVADYQAFIRQVTQLLKPALRVETQVEGVLHAYTRVGFSGDLETFWDNRSTPYHTQLHHHILSLTLESRRAVFQLMAQTCTGAAVLAARFSLPGGAVMALPAAWRYLQDVIEQAKKLAQFSRGNDASTFHRPAHLT